MNFNNSIKYHCDVFRKDGFITKDEFSQASKTLDAEQIEIVFQRFDTNKDGRLSKEEFQQLMEKHAH